MKEKKVDQEAERIKEQYEQALLHDRYDTVKEIETLYKNTSLWGELAKIKNEIDELFIA